MTKHKKFIKSEKAKIKLNLKGAKLPKGLNVTKTEFKIKKIQIREQLSADYSATADGSVIRKQNVRELLTKLQHHNATTRNEGLRYLKEQLATYPTEAAKHFGAIALGLAQLSLDVEHDVRKEGSRALGILLATAADEAVVRPFFDTLASYLRCAMTHIQQPVQEDSLGMLDTLLEHVPALVAGQGERIFQSFLDMISRLRVESKPDRTLSVSLGVGQTSVRWRSKVLDRLLAMLRAMVEAKRAEAARRQQQRQQRTYAFDALRPTILHASLTVQGRTDKCRLPQLFRPRVAAGSGAGTGATGAAADVHDEGRRVRHYCERLMPLMFETWMEVRPANFGTEFNEDLVLSAEAAHTLKTVLEIVERLYQLIGAWDAQMKNTSLAEWFRHEYAAEFAAQLFVGFPYAQADGYKGSKRKAKGVPTDAEVQAAGGARCHAQNLSLAYLFSCMHYTVPAPAELAGAQRVVGYLTQTVPLLHGAQPAVAAALLQVLRTVLLRNGRDWTRAGVETRRLLSAVLDAQQRQRFAKEVRTRALVLLCDVALDMQLFKLYGHELFAAWLVTLPRMLCQPFVSFHVLATFTSFGRQMHPVFLQHFEEAVPDIIANVSTIQVTGSEVDQTQCRRRIVELLFWLRHHERWYTSLTAAQLATVDDEVRGWVERVIDCKRKGLCC